MSHLYSCRVYHEDVDQGGIVYHSNYLKFAERVRTEWIRTLGIDHPTLWQRERSTFVVTQATLNYLKPARLDEVLDIISGPIILEGIRLLMSQKIYHQQRLCVDITVTLVLINEEGKPRRLPPFILRSFTPFKKHKEFTL